MNGSCLRLLCSLAAIFLLSKNQARRRSGGTDRELLAPRDTVASPRKTPASPRGEHIGASALPVLIARLEQLDRCRLAICGQRFGSYSPVRKSGTRKYRSAVPISKFLIECEPPHARPLLVRPRFASNIFMVQPREARMHAHRLTILFSAA